MALNFFRQRDIEQMDINDIPEEFVNYFETLDDGGKAALVGSRPDLAKALGFVLPEVTTDEEELEPSQDIDALNEYRADYAEEATEDDFDIEESEEYADPVDELNQIRQNYYEGKKLKDYLSSNMPELEALAIPDGATRCKLHRKPLVEVSVKYKRVGERLTYGIVPKVCYDCNRVYLEESKMLPIHDRLVAMGVPHTFYGLELTNQYLQSQIPPHEFTEKDVLQLPDTWVEENPRCPIHDEELYEVPCFKHYKNREVRFTAYRCDQCGKYLMRRAAAMDLLDRCAEAGVPQIETERLVKKNPPKKVISPKSVHSDYIIENGRKTYFSYSTTQNCYQLSENDTVVVSDSIYCALDGHDDTEEVVALIWICHKSGGRAAYLFHLGYCPDCQKYYMAQEDYKVLYSIGRPEVLILHDMDDADYHITSGEVFNREKKHLDGVESDINNEIRSIKESSDYVNPYTTGDYDDGGLHFAKYTSKLRYGKRLEELDGYIRKPYSYRVDIVSDKKTETYYIGAADISLKGRKRVISANSDFGHDLINYQTTKVRKGETDYRIKLSRQFDIDHASLYGYVNLRTDEDIIFKSGITDPFLVRVLNMRKRQHNLTDIFVTIQENQNRIVNTPFENSIIVQGCAGSGKTMVLLHRLSSLHYNKKGYNFSKKALIMTPNDQFTLHIKGLAEELQIGTIQRVSVEQYYIAMLLLYSQEFKLDGRVTSEMIVPQEYVDYIYSDEFRDEFERTYKSVIEKRNGLVDVLADLLNAMKRRPQKIDLSIDSKVTQRLKYIVDELDQLVKGREDEASSAEEKLKKTVDRKQYLMDRVQTLDETIPGIVEESKNRVYSKIGIYLSDRQHTIENLQEQIDNWRQAAEDLGKRLFVIGKQNKLESLDKNIQSAKRTLETANVKQLEELPVLNSSTEGKNEEQILAWMRQVMLIIPDVREEVRLCNNLREERQRHSEELSGIDALIDTANTEVETKKAGRYSEEVKRGILYLDTELEKYSDLNTFQQVFDKAVAAYKNEHNISYIPGNYHRYDLYARLLFAKLFYGKKVGTVELMCIDEGQDLALNEYRLLQDLNKGKIVFNVFGDTNQLIKTGRGISDWGKLKSYIQAETYELNENYRNTNQITRFCNSSFGMNVTQTGVDGVNVREIQRKELESDLAELNITSERIAVLVPRRVQKGRYLKRESLPESINNIVGDKMGNGFISLMYVDEVKGIEFDRAYVVGNGMTQNEKYIAYTRALSELILVVDEQNVRTDGADNRGASGQGNKPSRSRRKKSEILNFKADESRNQNEQKQKEEFDSSQAPSDNNRTKANLQKPVAAERIDSVKDKTGEDGDESAPAISPALKTLPKGYQKVNVSGALEGECYLVPYNGKLRNYTVKKITSMFIPLVRSGKERKVPVSVVEDERVIYITKEQFKVYEKGIKEISIVELRRLD